MYRIKFIKIHRTHGNVPQTENYFRTVHKKVATTLI